MKNNTISITYWKDVLFQASGNTVAQLIGIIGLPILTRLYTPENFADQAVFIQITALLVALVSFRFEYFVPILKSKEESIALSRWIAKVGFLMTVLLTLIVFVADSTVLKYSLNIRVEYYYYLAPITAYLICLSFLFQHEAQRLRDYKLSGFAEVFSKFMYVGAGAVGSLLGSGLSLILTTAFGALGKILSLHQYVLLKKPSEFKNTAVGLVRLYRGRAIGMIIANTLLTCSSLIPLYVIGTMYGAVSLGQFSLVMATIFLPSGLIGSAVGNVFYQRAGLYWNKQQIVGLKSLWYQTIIKLIVLAFPVYGLAFFIAPWAYPFVFGSAWDEAGRYAQIMSLAAFFSFIAGPFDRLSLVIGLAYYLPVIHTIRFSLIAAISLLAVQFDCSAIEYIVLFSFAMSTIYIFDLIVCRFFYL